MLTVRQAAAYAGCAVWAIRTAIWEKALSACTIGRRLLIPREGLDAYINAKLAERAAA
jgi:excisionase family DNA binding protein